MVVRHLNAGIDGFNRWRFNNRGNIDGQFQMIETWDRENNRLLNDFQPKPNPYFMYGLLSRCTAKHSQVLSCEVEGGRLEELSRFFAAALRSPSGNTPPPTTYHLPPRPHRPGNHRRRIRSPGESP